MKTMLSVWLGGFVVYELGKFSSDEFLQEVNVR